MKTGLRAACCVTRVLCSGKTKCQAESEGSANEKGWQRQEGARWEIYE